MSGGKQKTTTNMKTTPTNPSWVTGALQGYTGRIGDWANTTNAQDLVAPASALQNQAFEAAGKLVPQVSGGDQPLVNGGPNAGGYDWFNRAQELGNQGAGSAAGLVGEYMNPYQQQVIDASLADYDANSGRVRAQQAAAGAANNAFGGSRYGVQSALTEGELGRGRGALHSGLLADGFNTALGAGQEQRARELQAAGLFGNLGATQGANERANIGLLADLGGQQRAIDANYRTADLSMLQALGSLYGQGQYGLFQGNTQNGTQTTQTNPGLLGAIGQGAQGAAALAGLFSDRRLKKDVVASHTDDKGRQWFAYRYVWEDDDADLHTGVMAQDVLETDPHAVSVHQPTGFLMVDYGALQ